MHSVILLWAVSAIPSVVGKPTTIKYLDVPASPKPGSPVVGNSFISYSIEFSDFDVFTGNHSAPNDLSINLIKNLKDAGGSYPNIRVGGTTANYATFVDSQEESIVLSYTTPGADQPSSVTWGSSWLAYFDIFPAEIKYTLGLSFNSASSGQNQTVNEAAQAYPVLNRSLYAFEIGNEFDVYPVDRENQTWNLQTYVDQWLDRTDEVVEKALGDRAEEKVFQAGVFIVPGLVSKDISWTAEAAFEDGIATTGKVKTFSTHQYFGAACDPVQPTLANSILNHTHVVSYMPYHEAMSTYTASRGVPYIIGETNSIACQGLSGVSDVFGAALWSIDYALYTASLNVSSLYFHMGIGYRYSAWQPRANGTSQAGPRPLYYGHLVAAELLGGANKQVRVLANETTFAAYGIYAKHKGTSVLDKVVLINLDVYNSTTGHERSKISVKLPESILGKNKSFLIQRLTAPGAESTHDITWAGKYISDEGLILGQGAIELVKGGDTAEVRASEAVVVSFQKSCH